MGDGGDGMAGVGTTGDGLIFRWTFKITTNERASERCNSNWRNDFMMDGYGYGAQWMEWKWEW